MASSRNSRTDNYLEGKARRAQAEHSPPGRNRPAIPGRRGVVGGQKVRPLDPRHPRPHPLQDQSPVRLLALPSAIARAKDQPPALAPRRRLPPQHPGQKPRLPPREQRSLLSPPNPLVLSPLLRPGPRRAALSSCQLTHHCITLFPLCNSVKASSSALDRSSCSECTSRTQQQRQPERGWGRGSL